jgi:hypothetical protein
MKKQKLTLDAVRVESFPTGSGMAIRGTPVPRAEATLACSGTTCILQCLTYQPRCF